MEKMINKRFIYISILSFLILLIILLGFYPGIVCYDGDNQWQQVKSGIITNAHPFFSTFFMLLLSKIWNKITIVIIFQILIVSISWGYFCKVIGIKNKKQMILMILFTLFVMLSPLISLYSITLWKDTLYTSYLFLCSIVLYEWADNNYIFSKLKYFLLGLLIAMVFSYRHNGVIVAILMLAIVYFLCMKKYKRKIINKSEFKKVIIVLISFLIIISVIAVPKRIFLNKSDQYLKENNNVVSHSTIDGYILWMMGAHIKDNNINNIADKRFLNKIIPLEEWKESYNPYLINDTNFAKNLDDEYLVKNNTKLKKIFVKYSFKHPLTIFKHYLKADSLLLNPFASFFGYVYVYSYPVMWYLPKYTAIKPKIPSIENVYSRLINYSFHKPFIMFYQPALILYLSLFFTIILSKRVYGKKIWYFSMPMILNTISLLPINLAQDLRYVYINYFTFFGLLLIIIMNLKKLLKKKGE